MTFTKKYSHRLQLYHIGEWTCKKEVASWFICKKQGWMSSNSWFELRWKHIFYSNPRDESKYGDALPVQTKHHDSNLVGCYNTKLLAEIFLFLFFVDQSFIKLIKQYNSIQCTVLLAGIKSMNCFGYIIWEEIVSLKLEPLLQTV